MGSPVARMARRIAALALAALLAACAPDGGPGPATDGVPPLTVFAAASLKDALDEAAGAYAARSGQPVRVSYAASSALARQIAQRAPADVFVSADRDWMDWLQERGLVDPATRADVCGNALVLVAPRETPTGTVALAPGADLRPLFGERGRLALALASAVPAGRYARAAFESLGMWDGLAPRVAEAENVRAALLLVARGEAPLGVVYASDARAEPRVKVLATFPPDTHPEIVYPAARVAASTHPTAADFVAWLRSDAAGDIFRRHGFIR